MRVHLRNSIQVLRQRGRYDFHPKVLNLAAVAANGTHYALFNSTSSIPGVTGWKPSTATPIVLRFDSKGVITQALKASQVTERKGDGTYCWRWNCDREPGWNI